MSLPISGITILDFTRLIPGPFCTLVLSDLGAKVIKIEDPFEGDYLRTMLPPVDRNGSALFQGLNRNKKIIRINLKTVEGQKKIQSLVKKTDVLVESFRPGVMKKLNLSYTHLKKINPKLIYASISGYGQKGPISQKAGHDLNYQALSGFLDSQKVPENQWADLVGGGLWGALGIVAALQQQNRTKKGVHLDISMTDSMIFMNVASIMMAQAGINLDLLCGKLARYRIYRTRDEKLVALAALESKFWNKFCDFIQKPEWKDEKGRSFRDADPAIHNQTEEIFIKKSFDEWKQIALAEDFCLTPVLEPMELLGKNKFFKKIKLAGREWFFPLVPFKFK